MNGKISDFDRKKLEDARIGYQAAIDLWAYVGEENWSRFNAMIFANSVIIALIGLAIINTKPELLISLILSIFGLFLCATWFIIMRRGFDYQKYYMMSAREIEEKFLSNTLITVSRGGPFGNGEPVSLRITDIPITLQMNQWSRIRPSKGHTSENVIIIFASLYFLVALYSVLKIDYVCILKLVWLVSKLLSK